MAKAKKKYYAVRVGRKPGVYRSWDQCKAQVHGFPGAMYKSFQSLEEAEAFLEGGSRLRQPQKDQAGESDSSRNSSYQEEDRPRGESGLFGNSSHQEEDRPHGEPGLSGNSSRREEDRPHGEPGSSGNSSRREEGRPHGEPGSSEGASDPADPSASLAEGEMVAYVDGSFNQKTKVFGYGLVLFSQQGRENISGHKSGDHARHRNVAGEVFAAVTAIRIARERGMKKLTIYYDYQGIASWALGEWKTNNELTRNYHDFVQEASHDLDLHFKKVEAHTGVPYNEAADWLAKKGCGLA